MLDQKQIEVIEMMVTGEYTVSEAMKTVGISRQTYYEWIKRKEYIAEYDKRLQAIRNQAQKEFVSFLPKAIEEYKKICMSTTDVRTKEKALANWIDRSLGKVASTVNISEDKQESNVDILAAINEYEDDEDERIAM